MLEIGRIGLVNGHYEFRDASRGLIVRGAHPEWVLQAAAEVIADVSRLEGESVVEELQVMQNLGAADPAELAAARTGHHARFALAPRCQVALGPVHYFWAASTGPRLQPDDSAHQSAPQTLTLGPEMLVLRSA